MINHLYVNGCSFVCDNTIPDDEHFVAYMAQRHGWTYTNAGFPGSCNRRIIRSTLKHSLEFDSTTQVIVSLSLLSRTEINIYHNWDPTVPRMPDEDWFQGIKSDHTGEQFRDYREAWIRNFNDYGEIIDLAADVLMLTSHLRLRNIPYLIYSYCPRLIPPRLQSMLKQHTVFQELRKDPNVLDLFEDSLCARLAAGNWWYDGVNGHLDSAGHVRVADVLVKLLNTSNQGN
jgi:hypothetical protein